jgi:multiple sugar transport system permease protein
MRRNQPGAAAMFLAPFALLFLTFVVLPVFFGLYISVNRWHVLDAAPTFIGGENYANAIHDDLFWYALVRTGLFVLLSVPIGNAISLLFAVILNQKFLGTTFYKVAFYLPVLLSVTAVAVLWKWLYSADWGLLNYYINVVRGWFGAPKTTIPWIGDPKYAMPSIALMSVWWGVGGNMLIYLAAIKAVPKEMLEAAELDGATPWKRFWNTTIPTIKPALLFGLVISVIAASQVFGQSYIMTAGGPAYSTLTVVLYMYQQGFGQYQLGYASAVAYLLFLVVFALTLVQFKLLGLKRA